MIVQFLKHAGHIDLEDTFTQVCKPFFLKDINLAQKEFYVQHVIHKFQLKM